ncbi:Fc.00g034320.m01.CDS01 [Cosmosporella sp. VM-42]
MRFLALSSFAWLLASESLATGIFDTCSTEEAKTCSCPTTPIKRWEAPAYSFPETLYPRTGDSCPDGTPPCCAMKGPGPLQVSPLTSHTNLQCGTKYGDDQQDVTNGVSYNIEDCPITGPYSGQKCLHVAITPAAGVTVTNIHLQVDDDPITLNTKLGTWAFNKYCTISGSECWVPVNAILATFEDPPVTSLCGKTIYVAAGISISIPGSTSGATCFNQGTTIGSGNWFMYYKLNFECPETCLHQCCCLFIPPTKYCSIGTAFGYSPGAINLNGNPVGPGLGGTGCKRWGWYFNTEKSRLESGISGTLIVGAGGNDISKGTPVGTWSAELVGSQVNFQYNLYNDDTNGHFDLAEVHVYASCKIPSTCAPGQYTHVFPTGTLTGTSDTSYSGSVDVDGTCSSYYLIFHAKISQQFPSTATCPGEVV